MNFDIWRFSENLVNIQISLKSDNNNGTLHKDLCTFMIISRWILFRKRNVSNKSCRQNQNTHFMFNIFFRKSCRLWDTVKKYGRARHVTDNNIIQRMRFACCITKATDTHSRAHTHTHIHTLRICNTYCFPRQQWLRERASMLHCT
jgi:hypothetical protein